VDDKYRVHASVENTADLENFSRDFYTNPGFETVRVQVKEEWLDNVDVREILKLIWKHRARYIYYNREKSTLRLKIMGSSALHDSIFSKA
jgi:hypothetical protein